MRPNQFFCTTNFVKYRDINQPEASLKVKDFTMIMRMRQRKKEIDMNLLLVMRPKQTVWQTVH